MSKERRPKKYRRYPKKSYRHQKHPNSKNDSPQIDLVQPRDAISPEHSDLPIGTFPNLSPEELHLYELGQGAYNRALEYYYYPSLPQPNLIFDYSQRMGFFIDMNSFQITLNLANTPSFYLDSEFSDYIYSLSLHEISHYVYCPYDTLTNGRLLAAAIQKGIHKFHAPIIVNIFSDLIIDYRNFQNFPELMVWEFRQTVQHTINHVGSEERSNLWTYLIMCYEQLFSTPILPNNSISTEISTLAKQTYSIIVKHFEDESLWERKIHQIAPLMKSLLKSNCYLAVNTVQIIPHENNNGESPFIGENPLCLPADVEETFGDLTEIRQPDHVRQPRDTPDKPSRSTQDLAEQLAPDLDFRTFLNVMALFGHIDVDEIILQWYRAQSRNLLQISLSAHRPTGALPLYPDRWRIGDPIEDLDIMQSLLVSPYLIPNYTTRRWIYKEGPGKEYTTALPDLLLVLDSSGSMGWKILRGNFSGRYHIALLAAMAALHYVIQKGSLVAGINFSDRALSSKWTHDPKEVEQILIQFQNEGTELPISPIWRLLKEATAPVLTIVISDLELGNWRPAMELFSQILAQHHHLVAFFIDGQENTLSTPEFQTLLQQGAHFYCIHSMDDLIGLLIQEVQNTYSPEKMSSE